MQQSALRSRNGRDLLKKSDEIYWPYPKAVSFLRRRSSLRWDHTVNIVFWPSLQLHWMISSFLAQLWWPRSATGWPSHSLLSFSQKKWNPAADSQSLENEKENESVCEAQVHTYVHTVHSCITNFTFFYLSRMQGKQRNSNKTQCFCYNCFTPLLVCQETAKKGCSLFCPKQSWQQKQLFWGRWKWAHAVLGYSTFTRIERGGTWLQKRLNRMCIHGTHSKQEEPATKVANFRDWQPCGGELRWMDCAMRVEGAIFKETIVNWVLSCLRVSKLERVETEMGILMCRFLSKILGHFRADNTANQPTNGRP